MVVAHKRAKREGKMSVGKKDRVKQTVKQTDTTDCNTLPANEVGNDVKQHDI